MRAMQDLRPPDFRRQAHQNGFDVTAGFQAEQRAPIMQQIKLDIAAPAHQLVMPLGLIPFPVHPGADNASVGVAK